MESLRVTIEIQTSRKSKQNISKTVIVVEQKQYIRIESFPRTTPISFHPMKATDKVRAQIMS